MDYLTNLLDPTYRPVFSYTALLEQGTPHAGGLELLAAAERSEPAIAALALPK